MKVTTDDWVKYAKNPLRRGLTLSTAATRVLVARSRARRCDRRGKTSRGEEIRRKASTTLADALIRCGPTYVKLGQIASSREELVDTPWAQGLERLQDDVPAFDGALAAQVVEAELGKPLNELFLSFDQEPLAAASLGQVHRATRIDGSDVAIKVQRPSLRDVYDRDVKILRKIAAVMDRLQRKPSRRRRGLLRYSRFRKLLRRLRSLLRRRRRRPPPPHILPNKNHHTQNKKNDDDKGNLNWLDLCDDSVEILYREIDYVQEGENARRFAADFEDIPWVTTPKVYESTEKVLVMEFVPGVSLKKTDKLDAGHYDKEALARYLARAYFLQFCKHGFFNCDPHAGNLACDDQFPGGRLIVYDFGQVASLTANQSQGILNVIESIIDLDAETCVKAFEQMGVLKHDVDEAKIRSVVQQNFDTGKVKSKASREKRKTKVLSQGIPYNEGPTKKEKNATQADVMQYFQLPATYAFVARAISQLTGVATLLDKDFDFIEAVAPLLPEVKGTDVYLKDELRKRWNKFINTIVPRRKRSPRAVAAAAR